MGKIDPKISKISQLDKHADKVYQAALYYASKGYYVIPLVKNGKKLPGKEYKIDYSSASKRESTVARWFGPGGKFRGWNIGIACGREDGAFVVDVDNNPQPVKQSVFKRQTALKFEETGIKNWEILTEEYGKITNAPKQKTPSGGFHYLFKWVPNARSSTSKIAPGIDTRGGDETSFKGHIAVWPSMIEGKSYQWVYFDTAPYPPQWIIEYLGVWEPDYSKGSGRGNEAMDDDDVENRYTIDQVERILGHVDPDELSYSDWLAIGQAIHTQHPDTGLTVWDEWSKSGSRYEPGECANRWGGFSEGGNIRMGTLISIAAQFGYDPRTGGEHVVKDEDEVEQIINEYNKEFAVMVIGGSVKVLMEKKPSKFNPLHDRFSLMDKMGFKTLKENDQTMVFNAKGVPVPRLKSEIWLADERRRTYPGGLTFMPGHAPEVDGAYNTWEPWPIRPEGDVDKCDKFLRHIKHNLCGRNEAHYEWVLDWMADAVQDPMHPKGCAVILSGIEGSGKGTFCHCFGRLFGSHYKHVSQEEHLTGRFNGHLQDAVLVFADEVIYGGSKKTAGTLKAMVTEPFLMTERKGIDATRSPNCIRLVVASNESWFIPAGPQSRRWFVLKTLNRSANDTKYFGAIWKQMENGGYEALFKMLLDRKITSNLRFAPVTEGLMEQRSMMSLQGTVVDWWSRAIDADYVGIEPVEADLDIENSRKFWKEGNYHTGELLRCYENWCSERKRMSVTQMEFNRDMKRMGIDRARPRVGGKRLTVFQIPDRETVVNNLAEATGIVLETDDE